MTIEPDDTFESTDLPSPIAEPEDDPEQAVLRQVKASARTTLEMCLGLLDSKPARALNLIEKFCQANRSFLVELAEPEEDLREESDGPRLGGIRGNPYMEDLRRAGGLGGMVVGGANANATYTITTGGAGGRDPQPRLAREARRRIRQGNARPPDYALQEGQAMLDLVRINTNGLQFALRSARRLGNEELMEQIRTELGAVIQLEIEDRQGTEVTVTPTGDLVADEVVDLACIDATDLVVPDTTDFPFEDLGALVPDDGEEDEEALLEEADLALEEDGDEEGEEDGPVDWRDFDPHELRNIVDNAVRQTLEDRETARQTLEERGER